MTTVFAVLSLIGAVVVLDTLIDPKRHNDFNHFYFTAFACLLAATFIGAVLIHGGGA